MTETVEDPTRIANLTPEERETTVTGSDGDTHWTIWTAQRAEITKFRRNPSFEETKSGKFGTTTWAEFKILKTDYSPATGAKRKRKPMSPEQKKASAARLKAAREARK